MGRFLNYWWFACSIAGACLVAVGPGAVAEDASISRPSYSGVGVMQMNTDVVPLRIFYDQGKERREQSAEGNFHIMIKRPDLGTTYMVMPEANMAMETRSNAADMRSAEDGFISDHDLEDLGTETVAGEPATKFSLPRDPANPSGMTTFVWLTHDRIPVRLEAWAGENRLMFMELFQVVRGPQDPALFEIPSGMQTMQMPGGMAGPGGIQGQPGAQRMPMPEGAGGMPRMEMPDLSVIPGLEDLLRPEPDQ